MPESEARSVDQGLQEVEQTVTIQATGCAKKKKKKKKERRGDRF